MDEVGEGIEAFAESIPEAKMPMKEDQDSIETMLTLFFILAVSMTVITWMIV